MEMLIYFYLARYWGSKLLLLPVLLLLENQQWQRNSVKLLMLRSLSLTVCRWLKTDFFEALNSLHLNELVIAMVDVMTTIPSWCISHYHDHWSFEQFVLHLSFCVYVMLWLVHWLYSFHYWLHYSAFTVLCMPGNNRLYTMVTMFSTWITSTLMLLLDHIICFTLPLCS